MLKVKETGAFVAQSLAKSDKPYLIAQLSPATAEDGQKVLHMQILALEFADKNRDYGLAYDIPIDIDEWETIAKAMHVNPLESYMQHLSPAGLKKPQPKSPKIKVGTFEQLLSDMQIELQKKTDAVPIPTVVVGPCSQDDTKCFGCVDEKSHQYHKGLCNDKKCEVCWGKSGTCGHDDCLSCNPIKITGDLAVFAAADTMFVWEEKAEKDGKLDDDDSLLYTNIKLD